MKIHRQYGWFPKDWETRNNFNITLNESKELAEGLWGKDNICFIEQVRMTIKEPNV